MKSNVLYIIHTWIDYQNTNRTSIGGTTLHACDIINNTKKDHNYFILSVSNGGFILTSYIDGETKVYNLGVKCKSFKFDRYNKDYREMLNKIIDLFDIKTVHIHHLLGHYFDIYDVLKQKQDVKKIITVHDYFLACPQINLLYKSDKYCIEQRIKKCNECINQNINIKERINVVQNLLKLCDKVIVPNESIIKELSSFYKDINYEVVEHGIDIKKKKKEERVNKNGKFNVAFVGVLELLKGSLLAKEMIINTKNDKILYHFWGTTGDEFFKKDRDNYIYHGEYNREDIVDILSKNVDLVCLLTKCPETYCYTLSEVIYSGIPVIGIDLGAIGDRLKKYNAGWLVNKDISSSEMIDKISEIMENKDEYNEILNNISKIEFKTTKNMAKETEDNYSKNESKEVNVEKIISENFARRKAIKRAFSKFRFFKKG